MPRKSVLFNFFCSLLSVALVENARLYILGMNYFPGGKESDLKELKGAGYQLYAVILRF